MQCPFSDGIRKYTIIYEFYSACSKRIISFESVSGCVRISIETIMRIVNNSTDLNAFIGVISYTWIPGSEVVLRFFKVIGVNIIIILYLLCHISGNVIRVFLRFEIIQLNISAIFNIIYIMIKSADKSYFYS